MIQLTDKLISVIAPEIKDNRYFKLWDDSERKEWIIECQHENGDVSIINGLGNIDGYSIIGTTTKDGTFDFDCGNYVELYSITRLSIFGYMDYVKTKLPNTDYTCKTKEEAFITLLQSKGIFLENLNNEKLLILEKI